MEKNLYSCGLIMNRIPNFSPNTQLNYQIYLQDNISISNKHDILEDGIILRNSKKEPRGIFMDPHHLEKLNKSHQINDKMVAFSLGYWLGVLLLSCKCNLKDLEFILSKDDDDPCLYLCDFGMVSFWKNEEELTKIIEGHLLMDTTFPSYKENQYFGDFLLGFLKYGDNSRSQNVISFAKEFFLVLEKSFQLLCFL
jgi:hypothetical protein